MKWPRCRQYVDRGTREELAIANKWADGPSTPTPPGHWNFIAAPYIRKAEFSEVRAARAFALLNMALHDAAVGCWDTKYFYFNPRPSQMDPELKSMIGLPNFPSYTSGHSTFSGAAAEVLSYLFPSGAADFEAQKDEASISRLYGGIHYRSDLEVGQGPRQADRRLHGQLRQDRRRRRSLSRAQPLRAIAPRSPCRPRRGLLPFPTCSFPGCESFLRSSGACTWQACLNSGRRAVTKDVEGASGRVAWQTEAVVNHNRVG